VTGQVLSCWRELGIGARWPENSIRWGKVFACSRSLDRLKAAYVGCHKVQFAACDVTDQVGRYRVRAVYHQRAPTESMR